MATAFMQVLDGLASVLSAVPAHAGVVVYRNKLRPVSAAESKAITVRLIGSRRQADGPLGATDWETQIDVEVFARSASGADPALAIDGLVGTCWAALLGAPLGLPDVLDVDASPAIEWDFESAETPMAAVVFRLAVRHRTQANSLTPWSA